MESKEKGMKVLSLSCRVSAETWNTIQILASNLRKTPGDIVSQLVEAYVKKQTKAKGSNEEDDTLLPLEKLFREAAAGTKAEPAKTNGKNPNLSFGKIDKRTNQKKTSPALKSYLSFTE
ncbi:MAG: hypothetical protein AB7T49_12005 [Oligoflexales bacterium]